MNRLNRMMLLNALNPFKTPNAPKKPFYHQSRLTQAEKNSMALPSLVRPPQPPQPVQTAPSALRIAAPQSRSRPMNHENEEIWKVPNNVFNNPEVGNTPSSYNLRWARKPDSRGGNRKLLKKTNKRYKGMNKKYKGTKKSRRTIGRKL
jgi:hypothetical protein